MGEAVIAIDQGVGQQDDVALPFAPVAGGPHKALDELRFLGLFSHADEKNESRRIEIHALVRP